jgi:hypothetical protein
MVRVVDDNGGERALDGDGLLLRKDGSVFHTDGSVREGEIILSPEPIGGGDKLILLAAGVLKALIAAENEGKILVVQGGKFTLVDPTIAGTTFDPTNLPQLTEMLAAFGCGSNGTVRLGIYKTTPNTFLYFDENGKPINLLPGDATQKIIELLCANTEVLGPAETISYGFGCTDSGYTRKFLAGGSGIRHLTPPVVMLEEHTGETVVFTDLSVFFDLRTVPGYDAKFTTALVSFHLTAQSQTNSYTLQAFVNGRLYAHVACPPGDADSSDTQVMVPIPASKILNVQILQHIYVAGSFEGTDVFAILDGFML